jgi:hypothetical protein
MLGTLGQYFASDDSTQGLSLKPSTVYSQQPGSPGFLPLRAQHHSGPAQEKTRSCRGLLNHLEVEVASKALLGVATGDACVDPQLSNGLPLHNHQAHEHGKQGTSGLVLNKYFARETSTMTQYL